MRRSQALAPKSFGDTRPMSELNITPLIDVMLVLLVMFILAVPAVTHEVPVDLPQGRAKPTEWTTHRLELARDGSLRLDGAAVADAALRGRLAAVRDDPAALLLFRADPQARYERADQVLAEVKRAGITRLGFEGLAAFVR